MTSNSQLATYSSSKLFTTLLTTLGFLSISFIFSSPWFKKNSWKPLLKKKKKKSTSVNIGAIFGMDIGGTLTKIVCFEPSSDLASNSSNNFSHLNKPDHLEIITKFFTLLASTSTNPDHNIITNDSSLSQFSSYLNGRLYFLHFETRHMLDAINLVGCSPDIPTENIQYIGCTGGGAHKYSKIIQDKLEIGLNRYDELTCLVDGMHFVLTNFADECYTYRYDNDIPKTGDISHDAKNYTVREIVPYPTKSNFPYLVVNIGSGVSILKVVSPGKYERVSGTSLGGGTYWGLCRLLLDMNRYRSSENSNENLMNEDFSEGIPLSPSSTSSLDNNLKNSPLSYDEVLCLAEKGDASKVDMLVKDIYGGDYLGLLSGNMVASSFGKIVMKENPRLNISDEDLALALLMMITNNIGQVAYLNAKLHNCDQIFFVGNFLRHNSISCRRLSFAIDFWSQGKKIYFHCSTFFYPIFNIFHFR